VFAAIDFTLNKLNTFEEVSVIVDVKVHADAESLQANKLLTIAAVAVGTV